LPFHGSGVVVIRPAYITRESYPTLLYARYQAKCQQVPVIPLAASLHSPLHLLLIPPYSRTLLVSYFDTRSYAPAHRTIKSHFSIEPNSKPIVSSLPLSGIRNSQRTRSDISADQHPSIPQPFHSTTTSTLLQIPTGAIVKKDVNGLKSDRYPLHTPSVATT